MRLLLSVNGKVLAIAPLDETRIYDEDYLHAKKRLLKILHRFSIAALKGEPEFYLHAPSKMNNAKV